MLFFIEVNFVVLHEPLVMDFFLHGENLFLLWGTGFRLQLLSTCFVAFPKSLLPLSALLPS